MEPERKKYEIIRCSQCKAEIMPGPKYHGKYRCVTCMEGLISMDEKTFENLDLMRKLMTERDEKAELAEEARNLAQGFQDQIDLHIMDLLGEVRVEGGKVEAAPDPNPSCPECGGTEFRKKVQPGEAVDLIICKGCGNACAWAEPEGRE